MAASSIEVRDFPGISADAARILQLVLELVNRMRLAPLEKRVCLGTTEAAKDFAMALLAGEGYEVFYVVCLDPQHGVLGVVKMSDGTPNSVVVQVRTVAESCFRQHASSAILLHNHPGGATTPSKGDVAMTRKIARALKYLSITLCDHLIVAHKTCVSFKELALI
jgi:DNA repair protein RadC